MIVDSTTIGLIGAGSLAAGLGTTFAVQKKFGISVRNVSQKSLKQRSEEMQERFKFGQPFQGSALFGAMSREQEERQQRENEEEARRRRQHRIQTLFAFVSIVLVVAVAGGIFSLLVRYTQIEQMIVEQRKLTAEIDDQQKRLEELQVEINRQGNIAQIQDYARQNLNMDYAQKENTRVIALP